MLDVREGALVTYSLVNMQLVRRETSVCLSLFQIYLVFFLIRPLMIKFYREDKRREEAFHPIHGGGESLQDGVRF